MGTPLCRAVDRRLHQGLQQSAAQHIDMYSLSILERKHRDSYLYYTCLDPSALSPKGLVPYITFHPHMLHNAMECFR
jgi:hypothetical protein